MKIHTLSIDDPGSSGLVTMAAASEAELLAMLRENYAEGDDVTDEDLVQHVCDQGLELHFDVHHITPKVEMLVVRDPDAQTDVTLFMDGVEFTDVSYEHVDPGAGYDGSDWDEHTESVSTDKSYSQAFREAVVRARDEHADSQYIDR